MPWSPKYHSEALDLQYAVHSDGHVMTEDKTVYSPDEVQIIKRDHGEIDSQMHMLKSVFEGEVVTDRPVWKKR